MAKKKERVVKKNKKAKQKKTKSKIRRYLCEICNPETKCMFVCKGDVFFPKYCALTGAITIWEEVI